MFRQTRTAQLTCCGSLFDRRVFFVIFHFNNFLSTSGAVTAYVSHLGQILPKSRLLLHETLGGQNL